MNLHSPQTGPPRPLPGLRTPWRVLEPPQSLRPPWRMCPPPLLWMLHPLGCEMLAPPGVGGSWRMARTVRSSALTPMATTGITSLSASTHSHRLRRSGPPLCPTTNPFFGRLFWGLWLWLTIRVVILPGRAHVCRHIPATAYLQSPSRCQQTTVDYACLCVSAAACVYVCARVLAISSAWSYLLHH